jgi:hypothetical protein
MNSELNHKGRISSVALNTANVIRGTYYEVVVKMCLTSIGELDSFFANNYTGHTPVTYLQVPSLLVGKETADVWYVVPCSTELFYHNDHNLVVEFTWHGDDNLSVPVHCYQVSEYRQLGAASDTASHGGRTRWNQYMRFGFTPWNHVRQLSPVGGEMWAGGDSHAVTWSVDPRDYFYAKLLLSSDGGNSYPTVIAASVPPTETSYLWGLPQLNSSSCRTKVQIFDSTATLVSEDASDSSFTIDSQDPAAPALVYPPHSGAINMQSVVFCWHRPSDNLSGIDYHTIQIAYDSMFGALVDTARRTDSTYARLLPADTSYYWRVRGTDRCGNVGQWSQKWKFEIDVQSPGVPTPLEPAEGQWYRVSTVQLHWTPVSLRAPGASAVRYVVQLDTVQGIRPLYTDTTTAVYDTFSFLSEHRYWWRVRAYDLAGNQGGFSATQRFGVDMSGPLIAGLIYPPHLGTVHTDTVSLVWHKSSDAVSGTEFYHVQLSHDSTFNDTIGLQPGPTLPDTTVSANLPGEADYYWRVRARDSAGNWCDWSLVRMFTYSLGICEWPGRTPQVARLSCTPNPSTGRTTLNLELPSATDATVAVYDASGTRVAVLVKGRLTAGRHALVWHQRTAAGRTAGLGVYFVRATTDERSLVASLRVVR